MSLVSCAERALQLPSQLIAAPKEVMLLLWLSQLLHLLLFLPLVLPLASSASEAAAPWTVQLTSLRDQGVTVLSMAVDYNRGPSASLSARFIHDLQRQHNTTLTELACTIRFYAVAHQAFVATLPEEGTMALQIQIEVKRKKVEYEPLYCYFTTTHNRGSDFQDSPPTRSLAIYCPVTMLMEIGPIHFREHLSLGKYCLAVTVKPATLRFQARATITDFIAPSEPPDFQFTATTSPYQVKRAWIRDQLANQRPHGVCVVQNFKNEYSGFMLHLFIKYYLHLGFTVIVYDYSAAHREFVLPFLNISGMYYHPYSTFQILFPEQAKNYSSQFKFYYTQEHKDDHPGTQVPCIHSFLPCLIKHVPGAYFEY